MIYTATSTSAGWQIMRCLYVGLVSGCGRDSSGPDNPICIQRRMLARCSGRSDMLLLLAWGRQHDGGAGAEITWPHLITHPLVRRAGSGAPIARGYIETKKKNYFQHLNGFWSTPKGVLKMYFISLVDEYDFSCVSDLISGRFKDEILCKIIFKVLNLYD